MARRFDAKDAVADPDSGSNATDDGMRDVLEDHADDPIRVEFVTFVDDLNVDEQVDLVTLAWLRRGDGDLDSWDELRSEAAGAHNNPTASYLLGTRLLADYWRMRSRNSASPAKISTPIGFDGRTPL
jgi:hypothetical protein